MTVIYDGKKIIPAPLVDISKEYTKSNDGTIIGANFTITLNGKLFPCKGSPKIDGTFYDGAGYPADETTSDTFQALMQKTDALRRLFSNHGRALEFQSYYGSNPIKCYPKIKDIKFPEGQWVNVLPYTVTFEAPFVYGALIGDSEDLGKSEFFGLNGIKLLLLDASEDWSIEENEAIYDIATRHPTYKVSHSIKAVGKDAFDGSGSLGKGWQHAKLWVDSKLGLNNTDLSYNDLNMPICYNGFNHIRVNSLDKFGGSYTVNEAWILASGGATEDFSVSLKKSTENNLNVVTVDGSINGLEQRSLDYSNILCTKWGNALSRWNILYGSGLSNTIYNRALTYVGLTWLNPEPLNTTIGKNPTIGTISYSFEYNDRPSRFITNSLAESIQIHNTYPANVYAKIPVLGRVAGPVLQDIGSITERRRSISIEVVMPIYSGTLPNTVVGMTEMINAAPTGQINILIQACYDGLKNTYAQVFKDEDSDDWNPFNGHYTRNTAWTYQ
jgi:hypothetical protein